MQLIKAILFGSIYIILRLTELHAQAVKDADGNIYVTINIGKQVWMAENLKTTKYNDGKAIPLVNDENSWETLKTPAYCWLNNDAKNKDIYGALYNFYAVNTRKLCPKGWHVPTHSEWNAMVAFLGNVNYAGNKLKETGTAHWTDYLGGATNEYDFTALPGGTRLRSGVFPLFSNSYAVWWSSTEYNQAEAWNWGLADGSPKVFHGYDNKRSGFSVRCIID